jgi:hypothetical protein
MGSIEFVVRFVLAGLAVWRMSHVIADERGPFRIAELVRNSNLGKVIGAGLDCFSCVGVWMSACFSVFVVPVDWSLAVVVPALSGFSILLEQVIRTPIIVQEMAMPRDSSNGLLQSENSKSHPTGREVGSA